MADISAFQHKFRANGDGVHHESSNKVNKRNRIPVSCLPCRTRKQVFSDLDPFERSYQSCRLKCDKSQPCDSCTKRGDGPSCSYRSDPNTARIKNPSTGNTNRAQERLHHLEGLVMQLMQAETPAKHVSMLKAARSFHTLNSTSDTNYCTHRRQRHECGQRLRAPWGTADCRWE